VSKLKDTFRNH